MLTSPLVASAILAIGGASWLGLVIAQVPGVPEDLKTWPVTAMLTLITLASLSLVGFMVRGMLKTLGGVAQQQGAAVQAQNETNKRLDEMCQKIGEQTHESAKGRKVNEAVCEEIKRRPCLIGQIAVPHD